MRSRPCFSAVYRAAARTRADVQDTLFDLENGGGTQLDDSDLNEDVAKLRCDGCPDSAGNSSRYRCILDSVVISVLLVMMLVLVLVLALFMISIVMQCRLRMLRLSYSNVHTLSFVAPSTAHRVVLQRKENGSSCFFVACVFM